MRLAPEGSKKTATPFLVIAAASAALLTWSAYTAAARTVTGAELDVFRYINNWPDGLRGVFLVITQLGSAWMVFAVTLVAAWKKYYRMSLRIFSLAATAFVVTELLKQWIGRPRPPLLLSGVELRQTLPLGYGFPSGHSALATVLSLVLVPLLPKKWRWLPLMGVVLVGLSRIYLGVHAPLDVLAGIAIGAGVVSASQLVRGKLRFVTKITRLKLAD